MKKILLAAALIATVALAGTNQWQGSNLIMTGTGLKIPLFHGTAINQQALESGSGAMTADHLVVTFGTAFGAAPVCLCMNVDPTHVTACHTDAAATTTGVDFHVPAGGTATVQWLCVGNL